MKCWKCGRDGQSDQVYCNFCGLPQKVVAFDIDEGVALDIVSKTQHIATPVSSGHKNGKFDKIVLVPFDSRDFRALDKTVSSVLIDAYSLY